MSAEAIGSWRVPSVRVVGAGACVPPRVVSNAQIAQAIPGWSAEQILARTGIRERRFLWDVDFSRGLAQGEVPHEDEGPNVTLAEGALRQALERAGMRGADLDGLVVVTCSPDQLNFNHDALVLHRKLGMRADAFALVNDSGCGGALFQMQLAAELIRGGGRKAIAIVGVNVTSPYLDRELFCQVQEHQGKPLGAMLTMYLFGDGAGAVILRGDSDSGSGILASYTSNTQLDLVIRRGGGALRPPGSSRTQRGDHGFYVVGKLVAEVFGPQVQNAMERVREQVPVGLGDVARFYLHQANLRLVEKLVETAGLPRERVAIHMDRYGNTSAAGTFILLAEDLAEGRVKLGSGELVWFAAVGAGAQCASHLVAL